MVSRLLVADALEEAACAVVRQPPPHEIDGDGDAACRIPNSGALHGSVAVISRQNIAVLALQLVRQRRPDFPAS
jgi:hypothetical protein